MRTCTALAAIILFSAELCGIGQSAQFGGRFDPTKIVAAAGGPPEIIIPGESFSTFGTGSVTYGTRANENASRKKLTAAWSCPNIRSVKVTNRENWRGCICTFHGGGFFPAFACLNTASICAAIYIASESLAGYEISTGSAPLRSLSTSFALESSDNTRQAAACSILAVRSLAWAASARARSASALAASPAAFASDICLPVSNLYFSSALSAAVASRLCETIEPAVATPTAVAANAANITDKISHESHHSPLWPRNRVEVAAFALAIVSIFGGLIVAMFGVIALREFRRKR